MYLTKTLGSQACLMVKVVAQASLAFVSVSDSTGPWKRAHVYTCLVSVVVHNVLYVGHDCIWQVQASMCS